MSPCLGSVPFTEKAGRRERAPETPPSRFPARQIVCSIDGKVLDEIDATLGWVLKCPCFGEIGLVPATLRVRHISWDKGTSVETPPIRMIPPSPTLNSLPAEVFAGYRTWRRVDGSGIMIIPRCTEFYRNTEVKLLIQFVRKTNKWIHLPVAQRSLSRQILYPMRMVNSFLLQLKVFGRVHPWYWSVFVLFEPTWNPNLIGFN